MYTRTRLSPPPHTVSQPLICQSPRTEPRTVYRLLRKSIGGLINVDAWQDDELPAQVCRVDELKQPAGSLDGAEFGCLTSVWVPSA